MPETQKPEAKPSSRKGLPKFNLKKKEMKETIILTLIIVAIAIASIIYLRKMSPKKAGFIIISIAMFIACTILAYLCISGNLFISLHQLTNCGENQAHLWALVALAPINGAFLYIDEILDWNIYYKIGKRFVTINVPAIINGAFLATPIVYVGYKFCVSGIDFVVFIVVAIFAIGASTTACAIYNNE